MFHSEMFSVSKSHWVRQFSSELFSFENYPPLTLAAQEDEIRRVTGWANSS
jgi:hypothetical protein